MNAERPKPSRPSSTALQREIQQLRGRLLAAQAELEEAGEVERFLRTRTRDLNAHNRMLQLRVAELEKASADPVSDQPAED